MTNYADMKEPPVCFHALGQPLVDKMWQELQEQKYVISELKKMIGDYQNLVKSYQEQTKKIAEAASKL